MTEATKPAVDLVASLPDIQGEETIDREAERRLVRKLDWNLLPWICVSYLLNYLDRANLGNARTLNSDVDGAALGDRINLSGVRYSVVVAAFFVPYVLAEAPSNFLVSTVLYLASLIYANHQIHANVNLCQMKRFTPAKWIARIMLTWGIVSGCQAAVTSYGGLIACRAFLGLAEAGFYPGAIFWLTFWYKPEERATRMSIFAGSVAVSGAFSGLLATGISFLNGKGGLFGWQWLFILEAIPTVIMAVFVYFWMPNYPETARFLTPEERSLAVRRLSSHAPSGTEKTLDVAELKKTLLNLDFWLFALAYFFMTNSLNAFGFFAPSIVSSLGFKGWRGQAMTVPPNVFGAIVIIGNSIWSDKRRERCVHALGALMLIGLGYILLAATRDVAPRLVGLFFIACTNAAVMPFLAFRLSTVSGATATAIASGGTIAFANLGGITAPFIFAGKDAPFYRTGNFVVFGMQVAAALIVAVLWYRLGSSALYSVKKPSNDAESQSPSSDDHKLSTEEQK